MGKIRTYLTFLIFNQYLQMVVCLFLNDLGACIPLLPILKTINKIMTSICTYADGFIFLPYVF